MDQFSEEGSNTPTKKIDSENQGAAGETIQQVWTPVALAEYPGTIPKLHMVTHNRL